MQMFSSFSQGLGDTVGMSSMNAVEKHWLLYSWKNLRLYIIDCLKCSFLILSLGFIGYGCKFRHVFTKVKRLLNNPISVM